MSALHSLLLIIQKDNTPWLLPVKIETPSYNFHWSFAVFDLDIEKVFDRDDAYLRLSHVSGKARSTLYFFRCLSGTPLPEQTSSEINQSVVYYCVQSLLGFLA